MLVPQVNPLQYGDSNTLNTAFNKLASGATDFIGKLYSPGLVRPDVLAIGATGLTLGYSAPAPFGVLFGSGRFATAHGTQTGLDTQSGTINFSSFLPSSGSITAYFVAQYGQVLQNPISVPGPPPGNPGYNPNYVATVGYTTNTDTLVFSATTGVPDNQTTFEICRFILLNGTSLLLPIYLNQQIASPFNTLQTSGTPSSGNFYIPNNSSYNNWVLTGTVSAILPTAYADGVPGSTYNFVNLSANPTQIQTGGETIFLGPTGSNYLTIPALNTVSVNSASGVWNVINGSLLLTTAETYAATQAATAQSNAEAYARGTSVIGAPSGYMILPNGFILQYGAYSVGAANPGAGSITFPIAFPGNYITSWVSLGNGSIYASSLSTIGSVQYNGSKTSASFVWVAGGSVTFNWFVLGY